MNVLRWIEHNPVLTVVLLLVISFCVIGVIRAFLGDKD